PSITVDRELLAANGFLARGNYRPRAQIRPETHQRVDRKLQLGLSVDESALTVSVQSANWGVVCYDLLDAILDNNYRGRIEIGWLRDIFLEPGNDSAKVERIRYARAYIIEMIESYLMSDLSRNLVYLRATSPTKAQIGGCLSLLQLWARFRFPFLRPRVDLPYTFPLITRWNHSASYAGIRTALEDIQFLLDQRSEAQALIPDELFQNLNSWHVKVSLVNYATVEIHWTDRMLRQFRFQQPIPVAP
ncbi:hypothetical protein Golax_012627, partial [Gossypium laxum]|nr:hypothetical protein [Gossypium laxum]